LTLARWARTPRILFVDDQVLNLYRPSFPESAIPFFHKAPETERNHHVEMIGQFRKNLVGGGARPARQYKTEQFTVLTGHDPLLRDAGSLVAAILRSEGYDPKQVPAAANLDDTFENVSIFERIVSSELCVFILDKQLSYIDLLLAMAHAHCIPSVRLRYDPEAKQSTPELSGAVRWKSSEELVSSFQYLFQNYQSAFVTATGEAMQEVARQKVISTLPNDWNPIDGPGLLKSVVPEDSYVHDRVEGVMRDLPNVEKSRLGSDMVCRALYDRIKKDDFYYTFEDVMSDPNLQRIKTPQGIASANGGTCIDLACFFASMLEAAHERPVLIVVDTAHGAHAIAGYKAPDAVNGLAPMVLGDLRGGITRGEIVVFETTGAVAAKMRPTVAAETEEERKEGNEKLDYQTAKKAAERLIRQDDLQLRHFIDVQQTRRARH